ncbi:HIT family protein [Ammonifex thiophilus]|uniref:HIT family protein n=1 Tax=Ammonifex thiophilus TaxID=444093 RepID=A0A3D8P552_9THEO|nr:HIT family protein [Ammonifex thiophilus]RDV84346.1 HIT family protein [Ammonifex thiophilus]
MQECLFCNLPREAIIAENELAFAIFDKYPVNPGHTLVLPKRHFASFFEATEEEIVALYCLLHEVKKLLDERYHPDGYNVGVNVGKCAGQVIMHLHFHVIPRFEGDAPRPGGLRRVKDPITPWEGEGEKSR